MDDLALATLAASTAAAVIRGSGRPTARMKGAVDPVTEVDEAAERAILELLRSHRPDDHLLSEESGGTSGGRTWVIDPLDGTVNFVQGIDHVAVSVALWDGAQPSVGVVVDVFRDRTYRAVVGQGAEVDGEPLSVADLDAGDAVVATGFPYDRRERASEYGAMVGRMLSEFRGVRRFGSAALDLAWVAEGRLGGYTEHRLAPWDVAAGLLLVREAGGVVVDADGAPASLASRAFVAGSPRVVETLRTTL